MLYYFDRVHCSIGLLILSGIVGSSGILFCWHVLAFQNKLGLALGRKPLGSTKLGGFVLFQ